MKNFLHGAAYYPEQWGLASLKNDIKIMKELGLNCVRMAEFAWSTLEPSENIFDFSLFDEVIDTLYRNGIYTVLGTPTAAPPRWFTLKYPLAAVTDFAGKRMRHGSREHVCVNNADFLRRSLIIAGRIAEHYACNPAVVAYQIHNEPGSPVSECFCESCRAEWIKYLEARYGDVEKLNEVWHNKVWSFEYPDFESVLAPEPTPYIHSTSHKSVYREFCHASAAKFIAAQAAEIRKYTSVPLTTNVYLNFDLSFEKSFAGLDFGAIDEYSVFDAFPESVLAFDLFRGLCPKPFVVMETPPSYSGNVVETLPYHAPKYIPALALSSAFGGGKGFLYWQYRQSAGGAEMPHGHIVNACGNPAPAFDNVQNVTRALNAYGEFLNSSVPDKGEAAVLWSDVSRGFARAENLKEFDWFSDYSESYKAVTEAGLYRDIITEKDDFGGYKLIYAPYALCINEITANKLRAAAERGVTVIIGAYGGTRTCDHALFTDCALGNAERFLQKRCAYITQLKGQGEISAFDCREKMSGHAAVFAPSETSRAIIKGGVSNGMSVLEEFSVGSGKWVIACFKASADFQKNMLSHYACSAGAETKKFDFGIAYYRRLYRGKRTHCYVNMSASRLRVNEGKGYVLEGGGVLLLDDRNEIIRDIEDNR